MEKKKLYLYIPACIFSLVFLSYLVLCISIGDKDFYMNTTINGLRVGNMSKEEAMKTLNQQYKDQYSDTSITLLADNNEYEVKLTDNISYDTTSGTNDIYNELHESFIKRGYYYLFDNTFYIPISIKDEEKLKEAITNSQVLKYDTSTPTTYTLQDQEIIFKKGKSGYKTNEQSIIDQIHNSLNQYNFNDIQCTLEKSGTEKEMKDLYKQLYNGQKNASLDKNNHYSIIESQVGVEYDLEDSISKYNKAKEGELFRLSAKITNPEVTTELLKENLYKDVLGTYTTKVNGSDVRKNNVKLASSKCNEVILISGDEFSFNGTVGKRTKENGFGEATAYFNGQTVQEVGGGICQVSSTIYNAVILSNLEIVKRSNHSFISSYVPLGRDATVSWGGPDFIFKNNTAYPMKISLTYTDDHQLICKIYGTNRDGTSVKITSETLSYTPYETQYIDDASIEKGKNIVEVKGEPGATAQTYRHLYDEDGKLISTTKEAYSVYRLRKEVIRRGTKVVSDKNTDNITTKPSDVEDNATEPVQ